MKTSKVFGYTTAFWSIEKIPILDLQMNGNQQTACLTKVYEFYKDGNNDHYWQIIGPRSDKTTISNFSSWQAVNNLQDNWIGVSYQERIQIDVYSVLWF